MPDLFAHVSAGDPISAAAWNQIVDSLRRANERDVLQGQGPSFLPLFGQRGIVQIKNNSGGACGRFGVLGISGSLFTAGTDTFKQFPRLTGITPAIGTHEGKFCVLQEPLASGAVGLACASGVTVAKVYVNSTSHEWADIKSSDATQLNSQATATGCQIVSVLPSTGSQWAVVRIGPRISLSSYQANPIKYNLYKVRRESDDSLQYTILGSDFGTWDLSSVHAGDESDAGVTKLTTTYFDDPCLRLEKAGLWAFTLRHDISTSSTAPNSSEYSSTSTGETSGHYHSYDKFVYPSLWQIVSQIWLQDGGSGVYASIGPSANTAVVRWLDNTPALGIADTVVCLENLDAGTNVRILTKRAGYNITGDGTFFVSGSIICQWMREKVT